MGAWSNNSLAYFRNNDDGNNILGPIAIAVTAITFIHSAYLHRTRFKLVRILTDICSLAGLIAAIGCTISNIYRSQRNIAIGADLLAQGLCSTTIAVVDSVITYTRYKLLVKKENTLLSDIAVGVFIFLFIVCSSLAFYTIIPIYIDVNEGPGLEALNICLYYVFSPCFAIFNLTFSYVFLTKIFCFKKGPVERHPKLLMLAYKSCFHSFTSIVLNAGLAVASQHNPVQGQLFYSMVIPGVLHCLFNWHGDITYTTQTGSQHMSDKVIALNRRIKNKQVSPYNNEFAKVPPKGAPTGRFKYFTLTAVTTDSTTSKCGPDFLKPVNIVEECNKAIDEMEAASRATAAESKKSKRSARRSGQRRPDSIRKDNSFFSEESDTIESPDNVVAFESRGFL